MTIIQLHTHGQILFQQVDTAIAAGDRETVRLVIETDTEWTGYDLYAVLWRDGRHDLAVSLPLYEAGCCVVPALLLAASGTLHIALVGQDNSGRVKTSTPIRYRILPGAPNGEGVILANVARATATPDQVLAGVTFYAGGDQILTGAIPTYEEGEIISDEIVENLTVAADFSVGDQVVTADRLAPMRTVTVQKPDTLNAANIARGIRIAGIEGTLPTLPDVTGEDNGKILTVADGIWQAATPKKELPAVSAADGGKILGVADGVWQLCSPERELPAVSAADGGKILGVVDGVWQLCSPERELPAVGETDSGKILRVQNGCWVADVPVYTLTEQDKADIVSRVLAALPVVEPVAEYNGEVEVV